MTEAVHGETTQGTTTTRCARCGDDFRCGAVEGSVECWCVAEPHVQIEPAMRGCLCRACLSLTALASAA